MPRKYDGMSPGEIFEANAKQIAHQTAYYDERKGIESRAQARLRAAESATIRASSLGHATRVAALEAIHDSVTEETDPGEYLAAVVNVTHRDRAGDKVLDRLTPFRMAMVDGKRVPFGIVDASVGGSFGLAYDDITVSRALDIVDGRWQPTNKMEVTVPVTASMSFRFGHNLGPKNLEWSFRPNYPDEDEGHVSREILPVPAIARGISDPEEAGSILDIDSTASAMPHFIYGQPAVVKLLEVLTKNPLSTKHQVADPLDALSTAIALNLTKDIMSSFFPEHPDLSQEVVISQLRNRFLMGVKSMLIECVRIESARRETGRGQSSPRSPIYSNPAVGRFVGIGEQDIVDAGAEVLVESLESLTTGQPDDRSIRGLDTEHRLTIDEAREIMAELIQVRYGIAVDSTLFRSAAARTLLEARLLKQRDLHARVAARR